MKKVTMFLAVLTLVCLMAPFATAQLDESTVWKAKVPYDFQVENTKFAAGDYEFKWTAGRLQIAPVNGGATKAVVITLPVEGKKTIDRSMLQFNSYGSDHFLSAIWFAGQEQGRELLKSKTEMQLAQRQRPTQLAVLLMH